MTEPVRPDDIRISDADRRRVQDGLQRAHGAGQLDLDEFDERVSAVWAARTRGELDRVTADLAPTPPASGRRPIFSSTGGGTAMRVLTIVWASLAVATLMIWGIVVLTLDPAAHPWWAWVAGPPGAVLAVLYAAGIGRPPRDGR